MALASSSSAATSSRAIIDRSPSRLLRAHGGAARMAVRCSSSLSAVKGRFLMENVGPNAVVLEAQGRVCTGPRQTRPLGEEQAFKVFQTILQSGLKELPEEQRVSPSQMGAFFAAMTIRATSFPGPTQWSEGERKAMLHYWPQLTQVLPPDIIFVADPDGSMSNGILHSGAAFAGRGPVEMRLVGALRELLRGDHLGFEEVVGLLRDMLPLGGDAAPSDALVAAFLIAMRINGETDRELKAFCMAFDEELGELPTANVSSLTHYGDTYDGNTRFFRSTLFVAAVRACYGDCSLMHGVELMPPKWGVTEEQMLNELGAATTLTPESAVKLLEDASVGFAYLSQREARKSLYSLVDIREHIKKRPTIATTEKVQRYLKASGKETMVAGFFHEGYEEPLLMLMRRRGVDAGLIVKGEEGALSLTTNAPSPDASVRGLPVNFCAGFRPQNQGSANGDGILRESFGLALNAKDFGFEPSPSPRLERPLLAKSNISHGMLALEGQKGPAYDRIVFNAAMVDHLTSGLDASVAIERAREAIDSGKALHRLMNYIKISQKLSS